MCRDGDVYEGERPIADTTEGLQVKNMIRTMVTSGALTGEKVDAWMLKLEEEEKVAEWRRKAEAGDGRAMHILGFWHENGVNGLAKDLAKAFEWHEKSHEAGDATGTYCLSWYYLVGVGVPKCPMRGATLLMDAAGRGSQCACDTLGFAYAIGCIGFPKDEKMARRYYSMVASASIDDYTKNENANAGNLCRMTYRRLCSHVSVLAPARSAISSVYGTYDMSSFIVVVVQGLCELFMSYLNVKVGEAISV